MIGCPKFELPVGNELELATCGMVVGNSFVEAGSGGDDLLFADADDVRADRCDSADQRARDDNLLELVGVVGRGRCSGRLCECATSGADKQRNE